MRGADVDAPGASPHLPTPLHIVFALPDERVQLARVLLRRAARREAELGAADVCAAPAPIPSEFETAARFSAPMEALFRPPAGGNRGGGGGGGERAEDTVDSVLTQNRTETTTRTSTSAADGTSTSIITTVTTTAVTNTTTVVTRAAVAPAACAPADNTLGTRELMQAVHAWQTPFVALLLAHSRNTAALVATPDAWRRTVLGRAWRAAAHTKNAHAGTESQH